MPTSPTDEVVLGEVIGVFGIRGEVRLHLHHRESATLHEAREAVLASPSGERRVVRLKARSGAGQRVLGRIEGVNTPEAAAALHGWTVIVTRASLPPTGEGEYYIHDLLGLAVVDEAGTALGEIVDVVAGQRDVWVIATGAGEGYIQASPENVLEVDLDRGQVTVRTGALDIGEA